MLNEDKLVFIIQAGGRGSRLRHHTWNKPKCLVSVRGKTIIEHMFGTFPRSRFIIIGDYHFEQVESFLLVNPPACSYQLVRAKKPGTLGGISQALREIGAKTPFILSWGDLIFGRQLLNVSQDKNVVYTTDLFTCRWSLTTDGKLREVTSCNNGIPGLFYFKNKACLSALPSQGEFVKWFSNEKVDYDYIKLQDINELGDFVTIEQENQRQGYSRYFNDVDVQDEIVVKRVKDKNFVGLHTQEKDWYRRVHAIGFKQIPRIIKYNPLTMERIRGEHIFNLNDLTKREQGVVFSNYFESLSALHELSSKKSTAGAAERVYRTKTLDRVESVRPLIPHYAKKAMTVNGKKTRNFFHPTNISIFDDVMKVLSISKQTPIHGDPTYSNSLIDERLRVWFIDPRGSFDKPGIFGDPRYDWAKLYYSGIGGYDSFNRREFKLRLDSDTVEILLPSPVYKETFTSVFEEYCAGDQRAVFVIHALIWFALTGYARDDIDSVIGAFYLGNYWLEQALQ